MEHRYDNVSMASIYLHNLVIHYMDKVFIITKVDPDRYCYMDMFTDVCEATLGNQPSTMGMVLTMHCAMLGFGDLMDVTSTDDVLRMFELYRRISNIHVFLGASEIDSGDVGDNVIFDKECDFSVDDERRVGSDNENTISACEMIASNLGGGRQENNDVLSDYQSNDDFDFISNSDSDDECDDINRFMCGKQFEVQEGMKVSLEVGMLFGNVTEFREALRDYIIQEGFEIVRDKNEKARVTAHCSGEGCLWRIHASPLPDGVTYKIKTFQSEHTCVRATKNTNATSAWIAKKLAKRLRANPTMKIDGIRSEIRETYGIETSKKWQLYRARVKARDEIEGNHGKSYNKMYVYAEVVRETNSGSLVKIEYDRLSLNVNPTFKRFFICFEAMKNEFLEGCRPFIGLDGCHLKGPYGGVLLAAIALDENNRLFPVAFAIVEGETKESWNFFLHYLHTIIGTVTHQRPMCFMTDRQKGIVEAINEIIPEATHRVCCRHLYNNFKKRFPGLKLRNFFWVAARAYNNRVFNFAMDKMKRERKEAYEWLMEKPMHSWSRHAFDPKVRSDHVTNNMTESFNQWIGDLRDKPILTLVDSIRVKLMDRIQCRYEKACSWESLVTPKIKRKMDVIKQDSRTCVVVFAGGEEYEVTEGSSRFVVNFDAKSCSCRAWEISGLPCKHLAACIARKRANIEDYCDGYYSKETYLKAHGGIIHPLSDESTWPVGNHNQVEPPPLRRLPGRPKKNRRREPDEPTPGSQSRRSSTIKCCIWRNGTLQLCDAHADWEKGWEKIFDRVAGKKLASVRNRVGKLALTGCVQDFEDMKKRTVIWDSPPAADICRLGLGSR
ncbi:hypothetical protein HHK36_007503 [Tetracentron sinense]|uniref:SWIM-type domain-containing protein n=1 Tax=Tetracentron sinense TaxID=13715 RepID=A0A834ZJE0_TETSI|nr:hypothetical protein HHK36_007503 [Tetracentron sinense]